MFTRNACTVFNTLDCISSFSTGITAASLLLLLLLLLLLHFKPALWAFGQSTGFFVLMMTPQ